MKKLLEFIVSNLVGEGNAEIVESQDGEIILLTIKTKPDYIGLIIGKGGKTIRAIRNLVKVKATLEKKAVSVVVAQED